MIENATRLIHRTGRVVKIKMPRTAPGLRAYMAYRGIRQKAVAAAFGACHQRISALLRGQRTLTPYTLKRLQEAIRKVEEERDDG